MSKHVGDRPPEITNDVDFLFKFKANYIAERNLQAAIEIQRFFRGRIQRIKYVKIRDKARKSAVLI